MTRASTRTSPGVSTNGRARPSTPKSGIGNTLIGVFIGITLGLGLAAAVAFFLMRAGNPYQPSVARDAKDPARAARSEAAEKPRFDFYKILPGVEEPKQLPARVPERPPLDRATVERAVPDKSVAKLDDAALTSTEKPAEPAPAAVKSGERFWLQAGSFSNEREAENLKAQLALSGLEAAIQQATLPDRTVRFRVRLGPYPGGDELSRAKDDLTKRGVDVAVIRY
jgi:cell division protein FtsN